MRDVLFVTAMAVVALAVLLLVIGGSFVNAEEGCKVLEIISPIEGELVMQARDPGEPTACVQIVPDFSGELQIQGGWVFTAPVTLNGEVIETLRVPGEEAPQIAPLSRKLFANETIEVSSSKTENGSSEIGLWVGFVEEEPQCEQIVLTESITDTVKIHSLTNTVSGACIEITSKNRGTLEITSGWAFTAPVTLNAEVIETKEVEGEEAPQILPFSRKVHGGYYFLVQASPMEDKSSELGINFSFNAEEPEPEVYQIFMPLIRKDPPTLWEKKAFSGGLEAITTSWTEVIDGQKTCLRITFASQEETELLRGWASESALEARLNGNPIELRTHRVPGEELPQIRERTLQNPQTLEVCLDEGTNREIGIVLSQ